jgi:hypothetical protein
MATSIPMKRVASLLLFGIINYCSVGAAKADEFSFSYTGAGISASGILTATNENNGTFLVTSIAGQRNGFSMTLLALDSFPPPASSLFPNDNLLIEPAAPELLDIFGISFASNGKDYNIYFPNVGPNQFYQECSDGVCAGAQTPITFSATQVPEPSSWLLLLSVLAIVGRLVRQKRWA